MNQREPVPGDVWRSAYRVHIRGDAADQGDRATVREWAVIRYGRTGMRAGAEACAFWALSVAASYGVTD